MDLPRFEMEAEKGEQKMNTRKLGTVIDMVTPQPEVVLMRMMDKKPTKPISDTASKCSGAVELEGVKIEVSSQKVGESTRLRETGERSQKMDTSTTVQSSVWTDAIQDQLLEEDAVNAEPTSLLTEAMEAQRLACLRALPWHHRPSITWLLPFIFLLALNIGMTSAPLDQQIIQIICKAFFRNEKTLYGEATGAIGDNKCNIPAIQAIAAVVMSRLSFVKYVSVGFYTSQSDHFGRKYLLYLTIIPSILSQLLLIWMSLPNNHMGIIWLFVNALITGCLGANALLEPSLSAYIADCTSQAERSLSIGYVMVVTGMGMALGPVLGGNIIGITGDVNTVLIVSVAAQLVLLLYAVILPESHPKKPIPSLTIGMAHMKSSNKQVSTPYSYKVKQLLLEALNPLLLFLPGKIKSTWDASIRSSPYILTLLVSSYAWIVFAAGGIDIIFTPYSKLKYQWTPLEYGNYFTFSGVVTLIVYTALFPAMQFVYNFVIQERKAQSNLDANTVAPHPRSSIQSDAEELLLRHSLHERTPLLQEARVCAGSNAINEAVIDTHSTQDGLPSYRATDVSDVKVMQKAIEKDIFFLVFGAILYVIGFAIVPAFDAGIVLYIACGIHAMASVYDVSFTSLLTSCVPTDQTGRALGAICIMDLMVRAVSSLFFGWIFSRTSVMMPSTVYVVSAALAACSLAVALALWSKYHAR
ncbi:hypothetical protein BX616_002088 [Lobosporangium transversale]|nr:hypothetical protein BX616_002088 [Lobosporangium transversale]